MPDPTTASRPDRDGPPQPAAVVLATTPGAALSGAEGPLLERLAGQLGELPVRRLHLIARDAVTAARPARVPDTLSDTLSDTLTDTLADPGTLLDVGALAEAAAAGGRFKPRLITSPGLAADLRSIAEVARAEPGPLVVLAGDLVAHGEALARIAEPLDTAALVGPAAGAGPLRAPVRVEDGELAASGNVFHEVTAANGAFGGAFRVAGPDLPGFADVAEELATLVDEGRFGPIAGDQAAELLLTGMIRAGMPVRAVALGPLRARRVADQAAADAELAGLAEADEARARLEAAVKDGDGVFTTYAVNTWSPHLVRVAARIGLAPNSVTGISVGLAAIAATWFTAGDRGGLLVGAAALYLSFVFDCVDGQLARYTRRSTPLGAWLDTVCDRGKEFGVYAALAAGYAGAYEDVWALAIAAMLLLGLRHTIGDSYAGAVAAAGRAGGERARRPARSLTLPYDTGALDEDAPRRRRARTAPRGVWARRMVVLPIGERTALICVTAALFDARVTFLALLGWGGVATLYMLAGRVARSLRGAEA